MGKVGNKLIIHFVQITVGARCFIPISVWRNVIEGIESGHFETPPIINSRHIDGHIKREIKILREIE